MRILRSAGSLASFGAVTLHRWAESELLDTLMRLEIGLAGRVEGWKAARWASKLDQLKAKNDDLVSHGRPGQMATSALQPKTQLTGAVAHALHAALATCDIAAVSTT